MKRHVSTILLVLVAVGLGVWLWLDRDHVSSSEQKQRKDNVFVVWRKEELSSVSIAHEDETLVLERRRGEWRLTSPREERADPAAVDRLLGALELATVQRRASTSAGLGFEAPRASGVLVMGGLTTRFTLGGPSPKPEGSSYLRVDEGGPVVVGKDVEAALLARSDTYRDRTVVPYLAAELQRISAVPARGSGFTVERLDERLFRLPMVGFVVSRRAIDGIWAALADMRAESFLAEAEAERLTTPPALTLLLDPKAGKGPRATIVIGQACPGHPDDVVVLRQTPTRVAACAPKDIVTRLDLPPDQLSESSPFTFRMDEIEELRLERIADVAELGKAVAEDAPAALEIARKGTGFHQRFPQDRDLTAAEADAANEVLKEIGAAGHTLHVAHDSSPQPFRAVSRARVRSGEHEEIVEVGPLEKDGRATLRRLVDDARLLVDASLVRLLLPRVTTLRPHGIVEDETRKVTRVVLRCGVAQELVDRGEGFRYVTPSGFEADGSIVQLVDAVLRGRVDPWVADGDDGTFGFTSDGCHVVLAFADDKAPLTLWFGADTQGGSYARVDVRPGVFVAPRMLRELAGQLFVSRGSLRTESAKVERVRATFEGRPVAADEDRLRAAVGALYADRVLALGRKAPRRPDVVLDITLAEGGPPRRITCEKAEKPGEHECTTPAVDATFVLADERLAPFLPAPPAAAAGDGDAGAVARDGGAR